MKQLNLKEWEKILKSNGFVKDRQKGTSHSVWKRSNGDEIAVAAHEPNKMMCQRLVKKFNLQGVESMKTKNELKLEKSRCEQIAKDLMYPEEVIKQIRKAISSSEISRIMSTARKRS